MVLPPCSPFLSPKKGLNFFSPYPMKTTFCTERKFIRFLIMGLLLFQRGFFLLITLAAKYLWPFEGERNAFCKWDLSEVPQAKQLCSALITEHSEEFIPGKQLQSIPLCSSIFRVVSSTPQTGKGCSQTANERLYVSISSQAHGSVCCTTAREPFVEVSFLPQQEDSNLTSTTF